ncbi:MAG: DNA topoisomerase [Treponemataceae bacterium]
MTFILTDKMSVARDFATVLGCKKDVGFFYNDDYKIIYNIGSLYELASPDNYSEEYKEWTLSHLPIIPETFKFVRSKKLKQRSLWIERTLQKELDENDILIIATPQTADGELMGRLLLKQAGVKNTARIKRFWVSLPYTKNVILNGLKNTLPQTKYNRLAVQSYVAQESFWLYATNMTRLMSLVAGRFYSLGFLQLVILNHIYNHNKQKEIFIRKYYRQLTGNISFPENTIQVNLIKNGKTSFDLNDETVENAFHYSTNKKLSFKNITQEEHKEYAAPLYNLTSLQAAAYENFGYPLEKTSKIAEKLFYNYKCISYPFTDSSFLPAKNFKIVKDALNVLSQTYQKKLELIDIESVNGGDERLFAGLRHDDQGAIFPIKQIAAEALEEEKNIFSLILNNFVYAFSPPCLTTKNFITFTIGEYEFESSFLAIHDLGWKKLLKKDLFANETILLQKDIENLQKPLPVKDLQIVDKQTTPNDFFTIDTLLLSLLNLTFENKKESLFFEGDRSTAVKFLFEKGYLELDANKNIHVTEHGNTLLKHLQKNADFVQSISNESLLNLKDKLVTAPDIYLNMIKKTLEKICETQKTIK